MNHFGVRFGEQEISIYLTEAGLSAVNKAIANGNDLSIAQISREKWELARDLRTNHRSAIIDYGATRTCAACIANGPCGCAGCVFDKYLPIGDSTCSPLKSDYKEETNDSKLNYTLSVLRKIDRLIKVIKEKA